ncbi:hypothetical protein [Brevibacillus borstelensis]|uniref:hypothetical protein n=1 Tax=Brevibacillus borstelensis TaxID=45462 RepID=UPI0030BE779C
MKHGWGTLFEVWMMLAFGLIGYYMKKYEFSPASLILGLVLGKMMEETFHWQLLITDGNFASFLTQPLSAVILLMAAVSLLYPLISKSFSLGQNKRKPQVTEAK